MTSCAIGRPLLSQELAGAAACRRELCCFLRLLWEAKVSCWCPWELGETHTASMGVMKLPLEAEASHQHPQEPGGSHTDSARGERKLYCFCEAGPPSPLQDYAQSQRLRAGPLPLSMPALSLGGQPKPGRAAHRPPVSVSLSASSLICMCNLLLSGRDPL